MNPRTADFFDLKGDLQVLLDQSHVKNIEFVAAEHPALHPGQCAQLLQDGAVVGWIGSLHPNLQKSLDLSQTAIMFEIEQTVLETQHLPAYQEISKFPAVRRDIAIVIDADTPMQVITDTVNNAAPDFLNKVVVFDVYHGDKLASGRKSVALGLILQEKSRTLTESEVEQTIAGIIKVLEVELGATLRM